MSIFHLFQQAQQKANMVTRTALLSLGLLLIASFIYSGSNTDAVAAHFLEERVAVIVQIEDSADSVADAITRVGGVVTGELPIINALVVDLPEDGIAQLEAILGVQNVSIDGAVEIAGRGGGNGHHKVRDAFAVSGYSNDHGTAHWADAWSEINDDNNIVGGKVKHDNDRLKLESEDHGAQRSFSLESAIAATLNLSYERDHFDASGDFVTIDFSTDGGATWAEVGRISGPGDDDQDFPV
ncbi:MAG: hypothetical protein M9928_09635, partial [Anaerolineae bacterium]|nr:hypothetical protein [Anaerolineae bacterium]